MKNFFTKTKDLVLYIPTLIRFLIATVKAAIYTRKQLIKHKLLSKKEADKNISYFVASLCINETAANF